MSNHKISRRRHSSTPAMFAPLEPRQLMSASLAPSADFDRGAFGRGDLVDCNITLKQGKGGPQFGGVLVTVVLSQDKKIGNADDITFAECPFLADGKARTDTNLVEGDTGIDPRAGGYYTVVTA